MSRRFKGVKMTLSLSVTLNCQMNIKQYASIHSKELHTRV